jgi:hypothetical protein
MLNNPETEGSGAPQDAKKTPRRKEIAPYEVVGRISRNIEIDQSGEYHVWWGEGEGRQHHGPFETIEEVMNQHERVVMGYLGYKIPLPVRIGRTFVSHGHEFLQIKGESQQMAEIGTGLLGLMSEFPTLKTSQDRQRLERRLERLKSQVGAVRNTYKRAASQALEEAIVAPSSAQKMVKTADAAKDIFQRTQETISKAEGTIHRWNRCAGRRDSWERILLQIYRGLINFKKLADEGKLTDAAKRNLVAQIYRRSQGRLKSGYLELLELVTGQPYKERTEDPRIKRLGRVENYVSQGDDEALRRTLEGAIDCLWRVADDRRKRIEGEKKDYLRRQ